MVEPKSEQARCESEHRLRRRSHNAPAHIYQLRCGVPQAPPTGSRSRECAYSSESLTEFASQPGCFLDLYATKETRKRTCIIIDVKFVHPNYPPLQYISRQNLHLSFCSCSCSSRQTSHFRTKSLPFAVHTDLGFVHQTLDLHFHFPNVRQERL